MGASLICWTMLATYKLVVPVLPYKAKMGCDQSMCERIYVSDDFRKPGMNYIVQENYRGHRMLLNLKCVGAREYREKRALGLVD